jgi:membrane protease YdiL (CAAX protease family)
MQALNIILVLTYLFLAFFGEVLLPFWKGFIPYYYEVAYVIIAFVLFSKKLEFKVDFSKYGKGFLGSLVAGVLTILLAKGLNTELPFAMNNTFVLFFLVLVGPLLEELVFRFALWHGFESITKCQRGTLFLTSVIFALAHFKSVLMVSAPYMTFISFQFIYVLLVSFWWGEKYIQSKSISVPVIYHILFNLGFGIGAYFLY